MAAAQLFGELRAAGMSVRFDVDDPTLPPRVRVTDLEGRTIREIPPTVGVRSRRRSRPRLLRPVA